MRRIGYQVKVLNTVNSFKSMRYNPFACLRGEKNVLKPVNAVIANTKGDGIKAAHSYAASYCAKFRSVPPARRTLLRRFNKSEKLVGIGLTK